MVVKSNFLSVIMFTSSFWNLLETDMYYNEK